ncbi:MAG: DUF308 domain-containing protein [Clostridia bacterium]|nr:DUF308 domain-containing protein [Clostridia bacterium]
MNKTQKIENFVVGLFMSVVALIIMLVPEDGYIIAGIMMGCGIILYGAKSIIYYLFMARHMVGGRKILFNGIVITDFGIVALLLITQPQKILMIYLIAIYLLYGLIAILRARDIKKQGGKHWLRKLTLGLVAVCIGILCFVFVDSADLVVIFYGIALLIYSIGKIVSAFAKNQMIYIQ